MILISIIVILLIIGVCYLIVKNKDNNKRYEYEEIEKYYTNTSGNKIYTKLYKPITSNKVPIAIYSHGRGTTHNAATNYAKALAKLGVAVLTYDFRGGSVNSKSDGLTTDMSFLTECDDLETLISKVKEFDFIDKDNIILIGSSQGGAVSALVVSKHDEIKGTVLLYPALSIPENIRKEYKSIDNVPDELYYEEDDITVGKKYFTDIWDLDVYSVLNKNTKNIIIIHGTADEDVPLKDSRDLNKFYNNSKLYEIEGAPHGFKNKYFDEAIKHIIDYLKDIDVIR